MFNAAPFIANTASSIAKKVGNHLHFGSVGDLRLSSRWLTAETAFTNIIDIKWVVGASLGGSVAFELQKHPPELKSRTYRVPVLDLQGARQATWNTNGRRYIDLGDPSSKFDTSTHTRADVMFYDRRTQTHQYQNNANQFKPESEYRCVNDSSYTSVIWSSNS